MLSEMEQRIRECYDALLEAATEDRDLWESALLEYYRWQLEDEPKEVTAWLVDLIEDLLSDALWRGCGEAAWHLYEFLWEQERFGDSWAPLDLLREAAEAGCADAQCEVARLFYLNAMGQLDTYTAQYYGDGFSAEETVRWLEQALPHKIEAALYLARLFLEGTGVPADEALAVRTLTAAVEGGREETGVFFDRSMCFQMLAECYAEGRGTAKDRRKAAEFYRQARYSGCFLFDYYKDGAEVPRDPRAAVRYWMRDMCYQYHLELWNVILSLTASLEDCGTRPYSEQLRLLFGEVWQNVENSFYTLLGKPVEWRMGQADNRYGLLRGLLDQEKVRLLYDGVRGGDSRCGDMLTELLTSGAVTREVLKQMSPNRSGVNDWPDTWYEEALERIEGQMARGTQEKEGAEQLKDLEPEDLDPEEDLVFPEDEAQYPVDQLGEGPGDE